VIRDARPDEAGLLSDLAVRSKAHWGYDDAFMEACRAELTFTPEQVVAWRVRVLERDGRVVGMAALAGEPPVGEVEDCFVDPDAIGTGAGRLLLDDLLARAAALGFERLEVTADPNAVGFYETVGFVGCGEAASGSIPGRMLPRLALELGHAAAESAVE